MFSLWWQYEKEREDLGWEDQVSMPGLRCFAHD